jgi:hypothetical protein
MLADIFQLLVKVPPLIPYARYALTRKRGTAGGRLWSSLLCLPIRLFGIVKAAVSRAMTNEQRQAVRRLLRV